MASPVSSVIDPQTGLPDFAALVAQLQPGAGSVGCGEGDLSSTERPLYGTTLYVASCDLETRFGRYRANIFQDIIDKHYIIALAHGDICDAATLYTRLHSSCVTSETLRGCDCDCVQQLEGAFRVIAAKGRGILFYLMQEGRGVGYVAKARDRMMVQASLDHVSTFQAYAAMGLHKDHRNYENISHICHLLGITAGFTVLTNNPDKVDALRSQGLKVVSTETLEFAPSPFNLAYLTSKAASGHILSAPGTSRLRSAVPPEPVVPFRPHALPEAQRFIYAASYFLPIKPINDEILLTAAQRATLHAAPLPAGLVLGERPLRHDRFAVKINAAGLKKLRTAEPQHPAVDLLTTPYWFRVHVYYDIVTSQEFVLLSHGQSANGDLPVVRLQSESLFNRFPLRQVQNRDRYKESIQTIIEYGSGVLLLLYNDGRGAGFGAHAIDRMLTESGQAATSDEAYRTLGVGYESRDYDASMILLAHHLGTHSIQMVMNSPTSLAKKPEFTKALQRHGIHVGHWIFLDDELLGTPNP